MKKNTLATALVIAMAAASAAPAQPVAPRASVLRVTALAAGEAELMIYGPIGSDFWSESVSAQSVVSTLSQTVATTIQVRINSDGGSVPDGLAIYNALKRHPARKVVTIDGLAASIASLIAMAGDEVVMPANALLMLHAPWTYAAGNAPQLRGAADVLDTYADAMATSYARKTGKSVDEIRAVFNDGQDHYYTAEQAVAFGLADRVAEQAAETIDENASAAAALLSYINAISKAPAAVCAALRRKVQAAASPRIFAAIPAAIQRSVVDHIEDASMKQHLLQIMAAAAGGPAAAAAAPTPAPVAAAPVAPTAPAADPVQAAITALAERNTRVRGIFAGFRDLGGMPELESVCLADPTLSIEQVQAKVLAKVGAGASPLTPSGGQRLEAGADERDQMIAGITNAVLARHNLAKPEATNQYNGIGLQRAVRMCLARAGQTGLDRLSGTQLADRVFALHGSSDFPLLVANTANKALRAAYDMAPQTWRTWCAIGEVSDFKANSRIQTGTFNSLAEIKPGGEYSYGSLGEEAESIIAITKGKGLSLTRQLVINDDLGAFVGAARMMGFAAARTVNEDAYARLFASTTMSDGGALFNATAVTTAGGHANLAGSGGAIAASTLAAGRAAMALQKDKNLRTPLNLRPRFLLCPEGKLQVAYDVLKPFSANSSGSTFVVDLGLTLVSDANLDGNSTTAWYLIADPNVAPVIEVDFLDGQQTPYVAETIDWETDAMKLKVRLDYGVQAIDWRAGYKNPGA